MSDIAKQNYELAFHISASLEDADVQKIRQDLEKLVTSRGGVISFSKELEKIRLAYPIKHQLNVNFGFMNFNLESPDSINEIRDEIRLNPSILRFLILKHEEESKKRKEDVIRRLASAERRRTKLKQDEKASSPKTEGPKADEKEIDDKLEEIIEKL
jgi:ribosomal protein S6